MYAHSVAHLDLSIVNVVVDTDGRCHFFETSRRFDLARPAPGVCAARSSEILPKIEVARAAVCTKLHRGACCPCPPGAQGPETHASYGPTHPSSDDPMRGSCTTNACSNDNLRDT